MARKQFPEDANILDTLGWVYFKMRNYKQAISLLEESIKKKPDHPTLYYHLGRAYFEDGNRQAARRALERSLQLDPGHPEADSARKILAEL